jgi:A/G-specific adenine glycosylase
MRAALQALVPQKRAGDFAQALMDLGSAICTPKKPACLSCPWMEDCKARQLGIQEQLPRKGEKAVRPLKRGAAFVVRDTSGAVLLVKRPEKGLLGGMLQPPLGPWTEDFPSKAEAMQQAPFRAEWTKRVGVVRHGFTHFELEIEVYVAEVLARPKHINICHPRPSDAKRSEGKGTQASKSARTQPPGSPSLGLLTQSSPGMTGVFWVEEQRLKDVALPTVMRKIVTHGL